LVSIYGLGLLALRASDPAKKVIGWFQELLSDEA
jgi:hypothetical protein